MKIWELTYQSSAMKLDHYRSFAGLGILRNQDTNLNLMVADLLV